MPESSTPASTQASEFSSTCDLVDANPELLCCSSPLRSYGGRAAFTGLITTVSCLDDNLIIHDLLEQPGDGRVMVVDGHASTAVALLGDRVATIAANNGWSGVIINGAVRDVVALHDVGLGVLALAPVPRRAGKTGIGATDIPVSFGGVTFQPGARVWCDADGVVLEPPTS